MHWVTYASALFACSATVGFPHHVWSTIKNDVINNYCTL